MGTLTTQKPVYQMSRQEQENVKRFLEEVRVLLKGEAYDNFKALIDYLCLIQDPYSKDHPYTDSIIHGIEVARLCMMKNQRLSDSLLLAAVGHDWDRACGDRRIKATDFPNTKKGNRIYKARHSINSARLFCQELEKFYPFWKVEQVQYYILKHEVGGVGNLAILDFADGMSFFSYDLSNYFRHLRIYKGPDGVDLPPARLEEERKKGFATKVRFMTENMSEEDLSFLKNYVRKNRSIFDPTVMKEFEELLDL
jgi:hypothetical protein